MFQAPEQATASSQLPPPNQNCSPGFGGLGIGSNSSISAVPLIIPTKQYTSDYLKYCRPVIITVLVITFALLLYTIVKAIIGIFTGSEEVYNTTDYEIRPNPQPQLGGRRKMKIRKPRMKFKGGCSEDLNVCMVNPN